MNVAPSVMHSQASLQADKAQRNSSEAQMTITLSTSKNHDQMPSRVWALLCQDASQTTW